MSGGALDLFAATAPGLEELVARELAAIGVHGTAGTGGVDFHGGVESLYAANLHLRTASRVLVRVARFRARSFIELERHARRVDWSPYLGGASQFTLRVASRKSKLYHEGAIEERFGRWIAEAITGARHAASGGEIGEDDEPGGPEQMFVIRFSRDECTISADSSGEHLHRRGYRQAVAKAPLRETLAAAMLLGCDWRADRPLVDPLCGAGTIPIEAALLARRIPPGLATAGREPRRFALQEWPGFDRAAWGTTVERARAGILESSAAEILGSDRDEGAIAAARANAARAGVEGDIQFRVAPLSAMRAGGDSGLLLANPPYGVRVGETRALRDLYAAIGNLARRDLPGWDVGLLAADEPLVRQTGLEMRSVLRTSNGGIGVGLFLGREGLGVGG